MVSWSICQLVTFWWVVLNRYNPCPIITISISLTCYLIYICSIHISVTSFEEASLLTNSFSGAVYFNRPKDHRLNSLSRNVWPLTRNKYFVFTVCQNMPRRRNCKIFCQKKKHLCHCSANFLLLLWCQTLLTT